MEIIDGNQVAASIIAELKAEVAASAGRPPCIALVRVGDDPARVWEDLGTKSAILEAFVPFEREISVIVARGRDGVMANTVMTLSLVGGIIGIALGALFSTIISTFTPVPSAVEMWSVALGVIITAAVSDEEAKQKFPQGWKTPKPYLRIVPQPKG